jgi:hypothetical protein
MRVAKQPLKSLQHSLDRHLTAKAAFDLSTSTISICRHGPTSGNKKSIRPLAAWLRGRVGASAQKSRPGGDMSESPGAAALLGATNLLT